MLAIWNFYTNKYFNNQNHKGKNKHGCSMIFDNTSNPKFDVLIDKSCLIYVSFGHAHRQ